jgi:hypothetical protein
LSHFPKIGVYFSHLLNKVISTPETRGPLPVLVVGLPKWAYLREMPPRLHP